MTLEEAYQLLGIESDASVVEIQDAFRRLSKQAHPDTGAQRGVWDELQDARDLALSAASDNSALVPAAAVRELILAHEQALERLEERLDGTQAVDAVVRRIVRQHADPVRHRKRVAQIAAIVAAGFAGLVALLQAMGGAVTLPYPSDERNRAILVIVLAAIAAVTAVTAAVLNYRAQGLEHLVEDVRDVLAQRPSYLEFVECLLATKKLDGWWSAEALTSVIESSGVAGTDDHQILERAVSRIGAADVGRITIAKGIELGFLADRVQRTEHGRVVEYSFKPPVVGSPPA